MSQLGWKRLVGLWWCPLRMSVHTPKHMSIHTPTYTSTQSSCGYAPNRPLLLLLPVARGPLGIMGVSSSITIIHQSPTFATCHHDSPCNPPPFRLQLPLATTNHRHAWPFTTIRNAQVVTTIPTAHHHSIPFTAIRHCAHLFATTHNYCPPFGTTRHHSPFAAIHDHPHTTDSHYSPL